jgi:hypothetical protein
MHKAARGAAPGGRAGRRESRGAPPPFRLTRRAWTPRPCPQASTLALTQRVACTSPDFCLGKTTWGRRPASRRLGTGLVGQQVALLLLRFVHRGGLGAGRRGGRHVDLLVLLVQRGAALRAARRRGLGVSIVRLLHAHRATAAAAREVGVQHRVRGKGDQVAAKAIGWQRSLVARGRGRRYGGARPARRRLEGQGAHDADHGSPQSCLGHDRRHLERRLRRELLQRVQHQLARRRARSAGGCTANALGCVREGGGGATGRTSATWAVGRANSKSTMKGLWMSLLNLR